MPAGSTGSFPRSSDSRTTAKHAFKPPENGGTVSQSRAERWQKATGSTQSRSPSPSPKKSPSPKPSARKTAAPPSRSPPPRSSSPPKVPPGKTVPLIQKPMARDTLDLKKVIPPSDIEEKWFTWEPLNPLPGRHGPKDFGPPRLGMSHPPMNAKVRKELLAYLYARKVRPPKRIKKEKREDEAEADSFSPADLRVAQERSAPDQRPGRSKRPRTKSSSLPLLRDLRSSPTEEQAFFGILRLRLQIFSIFIRQAIGESNSVQMTLQQARAATEDLETYTKAYEVRLSAMNALQLRQLRQLSMQLHRYLGALEAPAALTVGGFLVALGADHFDLPSLAAFVQRTELARKVRHFSEKVNLGKALASSSVYALADLLTALEHSSAEDRIICEPGSQRGDAMLRYLSLDAEARFQEILVSARAVLFAGGTLEPRELRPLAARGASLRCFQGRHVVPPDHVLARYVTHGPAGELLDFRKDKRCSASMVAELQQILTSAAAATKGGMVVFFPSYEYLSVVANSFASRSYWRADGCLLAGRPLFVETEPKQGAAQGPKDPPKTLQSFAHAVREEGAAILLAVSGGSLSEGIDFKDDLCRLVAVVGLPYPNASDLAMVEKMRFLDAKRKSRSDGGLSGRDFYSAKCMKAVNQCIGRSIRHARDWSAILLLDHRYAQPGIHQQISRWLREAATAVGFKDALAQLQNFFLKVLTCQSYPEVVDLCSDLFWTPVSHQSCRLR